MYDNDNDEPVVRTPREESAEMDFHRRMKTVLPLFNTFIGRLNGALASATANGEPLDLQALAVDYRLWRDAADKEIVAHWNQFEQSLTAEERVEQLPHAAEDFAEEILRPSEFEAIRDFLASLTPPKLAREGEQLYQAYEQVRALAPTINTTNTTSFVNRTKPKEPSGIPFP